MLSRAGGTPKALQCVSEEIKGGHADSRTAGDASGRRIDTTAERAEAARRKREKEEMDASRANVLCSVGRQENRKQMERDRLKEFARAVQKDEMCWNDPAVAFLLVRSEYTRKFQLSIWTSTASLH